MILSDISAYASFYHLLGTGTTRSNICCIQWEEEVAQRNSKKDLLPVLHRRMFCDIGAERSYQRTAERGTRSEYASAPVVADIGRAYFTSSHVGENMRKRSAQSYQ